MQIEARFRRSASVGESVAELNNALLRELSEIKGLWLEPKSIEDVYFDAGTGESAASNLSSCLDKDIKGAISYASRLPASIVDKAISDDSIIFKFDSDNIDLKWFSYEVFPKIVKIFSAYRAAVITDLDQDLDDFEEIVQESQRTGRDVDGRDSVFRIHPVNYFDEMMCKRAFGISTNEVKARINDLVEQVELTREGVLLVVNTNPIVGAQLNEVNEIIIKALNV